MEKKSCNICGHAINPEDLVVHRIIPEEVARQARIFDFRTARLCLNCSNEIQTWYRKKVYDMSYDYAKKRFIPKSPTKMVEEYEAAFKSFAAYKRRHSNF